MSGCTCERIEFQAMGLEMEKARSVSLVRVLGNGDDVGDVVRKTKTVACSQLVAGYRVDNR